MAQQQNLMKENGSNKFASKIGWSFEEQEELRKIVEEVGMGKWKEISEKLNQKFPNHQRTNKQCRERYINFQQMQTSQGKPHDWSHSDLEKLLRLAYELKAKWSLVRKQLENWSENFLKNKFNGFLHKVLRKIQIICRQKHKNNYKTIKFNTLVRLFLFPCNNELHKEEAVSVALEVRQRILEEAVEIEKGNGSWEILSSIEEGIHRFACLSKAYLMNMGKRRSNPKNEKSKSEVSDDDSGFHAVLLLKKPILEILQKSSKSHLASGDKLNNEQDLTFSFDANRQKKIDRLSILVVPCLPQSSHSGQHNS